MPLPTIRLVPPAETAASVVVRVGDPRVLPLPRGAELAGCSRCNKSVWTDPAAQKHAESNGVKIEHVCTVCFAAEYPGITLTLTR